MVLLRAVGDDDCPSDHACALDHCVVKENVACRARADCGENEACVLSGYSSGRRNNDNMKAYCLDLKGGEPQVMPEYPAESFIGGPSPSKELSKVLHQRLKEKAAN